MHTVLQLISVLEVLEYSPTERILIHSAAGGVGLVAIQYALKVGAEVFATASAPSMSS